MVAVVWGVVTDGRIVPSSPLPEGTRVEIRVCESPADVPAELQAELECWQLAGAESLELVERLAHESETHEKG